MKKRYSAVIFIFAASFVAPFSVFANGRKDVMPNDDTVNEMPQGKPGRGMVSGQEQNVTAVLVGELTVDGKSVTVKDKTLKSVKPGQNVVLVLNGGSLTLSGVILSKTGDSPDANQSNFTGMNAAALASSGAQLSLKNVQITSDADGSNAVFATGFDSLITVAGLKVHTKGNSSRGLDATYGGTIQASDVEITTEGAHCAAIATDRGEGTIIVTGGKVSTAGDGSPNIYSTGNITATGLTGNATGAEIAAVEGKNSITLDGCDLTGAGSHGIMLYQSFSGDAGTGTAQFTAKNSKLTSLSDGPFFYITNTNAKAELSGCTLSYPSGTLVQVSGNDGQRGWGQQGSNGGTFLLTAHGQTLSGNIVCDDISSMDFVLAADAVYTGTINSTKEGTVSVTLEKSAVWNVTGDSYLASVQDTDVSFANIKSNGHTIYYDVNNASNGTFAGKTITLADGGKFAPYTAEHKTVSVQQNDMRGGPDMNGSPRMQMGMGGGNGMGPGGMQQKTYTALLSVKGEDKAVYLSIDGSMYKVVLPEPPAGKQGNGPGEQGGSPDNQMNAGMMGNPPDGGSGQDVGGRPQPMKIPTMKELRTLDGRKVLCSGSVRNGKNGIREFVLFSCKKVQ
jgi:hypothetical protein